MIDKNVEICYTVTNLGRNIMKKIALLIFGGILLFTSYGIFTAVNSENQTKNTKNQESIDYRIEEENNLISSTKTTQESNDLTDQEFTTYIEKIDYEVGTITTKSNPTPEEEKTLTNTFITLTDFIFYGGEIKGKTFATLTASAKSQVITLYEKIDTKIEASFPGYKEKIKQTSTKTYNDIKDKLVNLKASLANKYKEEIGEENYNDQVDTFNESKETMKESFTPVIDKIVDETKELYETTKNKLDSWYQSWKEENN